MQVPPFKHGVEAHSSMLTEQSVPEIKVGSLFILFFYQILRTIIYSFLIANVHRKLSEQIMMSRLKIIS